MTKIVWKYFVFAPYTSNDDTGFWKKHSFRSKNLVLPKNYQGAKLNEFEWISNIFGKLLLQYSLWFIFLYLAVS